MLPKAFCDRMEDLLGQEAQAFFEAMAQPSRRAVHVNTAKISPEKLFGFFSGLLSPIDYAKDSFLLEQEVERLGLHPVHRAGGFYVQDPGAMTAVSAIDIQKGWRVADLCAAPGGKSFQLSSAVGEEGFLLSNEFNLPRCRVLYSNLERLGTRHAVVTNTDVPTISGLYPDHFDLVLVDAPCSGEGMFRKYGHAGEEWSEGEVRACAERQKDILSHAAKMVKPGGYLLYSTCTFSLEEDEAVIDQFLSANSAFSLTPVREAVRQKTSPGIVFPGSTQGEKLRMCRRFYPHIAPGEGQFLSLMRREESDCAPHAAAFRDALLPLSKEESRVVLSFLQEVMPLPNGYRLGKMQDNILLLPEKIALPPRFVYAAGVTVGVLRKGRVEPHHQLFSAFGDRFYRKHAFEPEDETLAHYLRGETFSTSQAPGYAAVTVAGCALGGVKVSGGVAKNHYPKGLRG